MNTQTNETTAIKSNPTTGKLYLILQGIDLNRYIIIDTATKYKEAENKKVTKGLIIKKADELFKWCYEATRRNILGSHNLKVRKDSLKQAINNYKLAIIAANGKFAQDNLDSDERDSLNSAIEQLTNDIRTIAEHINTYIDTCTVTVNISGYEYAVDVLPHVTYNPVVEEQLKYLIESNKVDYARLIENISKS